MSAKPIPEGYHSVTSYLTVDDAKAALDFYQRAFGATEMFRLPMPVLSDAAGGVEGGDRIGHSEIRIGDSVVMLSDEFPEMDKLGPKKRGGATAALMIYLEDVDTAFSRAVAAGAIEQRPVEDQFYGDRSGTVADPFGHSWTLSTHVEDVSEDEIERRMAAWTESQAEPT